MKLSKYFFAAFALFATASIGFTSCEDQPDKYEVTEGVPAVKYIRLLSSEIVGSNDADDTHYTNGELVESAGPGNTICLIGDNLTSVTEIYFNDLKAVLNNSYITSNTLIVDVPKDIPGEVNNLITLKTQDGAEVTVPFSVIIPKPTITRMNCEYAAKGSEETIIGRYFINDPGTPLKVTFVAEGGGEVEAKINAISEDFTKIDIVVPENAAEGPITVTSVYGKTVSGFHYLDSRGFIFDFDGQTTLYSAGTGWHPREVKSDEWSINGNYVQLGKDGGASTLDAEAGWNDGDYSFEYWPGNWKDSAEDYKDAGSYRIFDIVDFTDWSNMSLKFEMCIPAEYPWKSGAMQIVFAGTNEVTLGSAGTDLFGNPTGGCNNVYFNDDHLPRALYRPWSQNGGSYDTGGKWITVTLPFATEFVYGASGAKASSNLAKDSFASLLMFVWSGGVEGQECHPVIKIDNIRAVPNK